MDKVKQGKKNRQSGARFERKVRLDLESKGWIVDRWSNNVELQKENSKEVIGISTSEGFIYGKLIPAKSNRFGMRTTGFPDFVAFKAIGLEESKEGVYFEISSVLQKKLDGRWSYEVIGVECKSNGYLDKEEKAKCKWLIDNNIFSKILIAKKGKKRGEIEYTEWENKS